MRWMKDEATGRAAAVCLYCGAEAEGDPARTHYCFCRSGGSAGEVVAQSLVPGEPARAA